MLKQKKGGVMEKKQDKDTYKTDIVDRKMLKGRVLVALSILRELELNIYNLKEFDLIKDQDLIDESLIYLKHCKLNIEYLTTILKKFDNQIFDLIEKANNEKESSY